MTSPLFLLLPLLCWAAIPHNPKPRGYPLFFSSFSDVGESIVQSDIIAIKKADEHLTRWTKGCPADAFILIKDSTPFQLSGLKKLQRLGETSLTRGTFLTDYMVNLHEFALDLEDYCEANLINVDPKDLDSIPKLIDTRTRVYYVELDKDATAEDKDAILTAVLHRVSSPFITVIYTSAFMQSQPMLRSLKTNSKRGNWEKTKLKHSRQFIAPVIAPLFENVQSGHLAPEPLVDMPDHFFTTLLIASTLGVVMLAYRDITSWWTSSEKQST